MTKIDSLVYFLYCGRMFTTVDITVCQYSGSSKEKNYIQCYLHKLN